MKQDKISSNVKLDFNFEEFYKLDKIIDVASELESYSEKLNNYLSSYLDSMFNTIEEVESYMTEESWGKLNEIFSFDDEQDKELIKNTSLSDKLEVLFFYENDYFYLTNGKFVFGSRVNEFIDEVYLFRRNDIIVLKEFIKHYLYKKNTGRLHKHWQQTKTTETIVSSNVKSFAPCPNIKYSRYEKYGDDMFSLISNYKGDIIEFIISKDNILDHVCIFTKGRIKILLEEYFDSNRKPFIRWRKYLS